MKKKKCLVVGLGNIGLNYDIKKKKSFLTHCKCIHYDNNLELIGGVDKNLNKKKVFIKNYKKPYFNTTEKALSVLKPDILVISSPTNNHYKIFIKIKKSKNIKYIILEKPGTYSYYQLKKIFLYSKKKNIKVFLNYYRIFNNYYLKIAKKINFNKKNKIIIHYSGGIYNICSHFISFFKFYNKSVLCRVEVLKTYKNKKNDFEADFKVFYDKIEILFLKNKKIKKNSIEMSISNKNSFWFSIKNLNEFINYKVKKNFIKNKKKTHFKKIFKNKDIFITQKNFYDKIFKLSFKEYNNYKDNALNTLKDLNSIVLTITKFNRNEKNINH
jgi:hypothetical protein